MLKRVAIVMITWFCIGVADFTVCVRATPVAKIPVVSQVYKEGVYRFNNTKALSIDITLMTQKKMVLSIYNSSLNMVYFLDLKRGREVTVTDIEIDSVISIIGEGSVALRFNE